MRSATILAGLVLLGAAPHQQQPNAVLIAKAKAQIEHKLRDPSSVQYRNIHVLPNTGEGARVCGEVNAKNGYGGYDGFTRFAYKATYDDVWFAEAGDSMFELYWAGC
jgi:hypothetical protein